MKEIDVQKANSKLTQKQIVTRHLVSGASAGILSRTATAPIDRVKVLMQVKGDQMRNLWHCVVHILNVGGWRSFWRGNLINSSKVSVESSLKFTVYEQLKRYIKNETNDSDVNLFHRFVAAASTGALVQTLVYPIDTIKVRVIINDLNPSSGSMKIVKEIFLKEGLIAFYRGCSLNLLGVIPFYGIELSCYDVSFRLNYSIFYNKN